MTRFARCQSCGQPLPVQRLGVVMTPLQGRIFDAVQRAGKDGIEVAELFDLIFADRNIAQPTRKSLHVHIYHLNQRLGHIGYQIHSRRVRPPITGQHQQRPSAYWLVKGERTNPRDKISARQAKALGL